MVELITVLKSVATIIVVPAIVMTLMGLGIAPLDEKLAGMAEPFLEPLGIPCRAFLCVLGPGLFLGGISLWGIGPMPKTIGKIGLMLASACGAYGHHSVGESFVPSLVYCGMIASIGVLEHKSSTKGEKE